MVHNKLNFAPIREDSRVLDIGTGTGIWAIEFAKRYTKSTVIGTDISLIQPRYSLPSNCSFEREDAEDEWMFDAPFDFIRWRLMASCFRCVFFLSFSLFFFLLLCISPRSYPSNTDLTDIWMKLIIRNT